jgi:hypothetical protein
VGWISVGLGGWLLVGFWVAHAFGRAAKDDPVATRHEPEVQRRLPVPRQDGDQPS